MERGTPSKGGAAAGARPKESTAAAVERIRRQREDRRRSAEHVRRERDEAVARVEAAGGVVGDVDFQRMIATFRQERAADARKHDPPGENDICVVVRKRPINEREKKMRDWDSVTILNPRVVVHAPKLRVDGITKYLENTMFEFDHTFDEGSETEDVYKYAVMPLVAYAFQHHGHGTCLAYGQTGSGKTHTMSGIHQLVARDVFRALRSRDFSDAGLSVHVSFLEIYGARCSDLLHDRAKVVIREDGKQRVVAAGLQDVACASMEELLSAIEHGNEERVTHATEVNSQSSRSHAVCEISIRRRDGKVHGSLTMVDLAGSERAADSRNHSRQRRIEGAEINKSLLALKECIRALAVRAVTPAEVHVHVPFRASKLTLVLKDSFTSDSARVVMIATVSPNASSADHTQNTLRYADRVKEKPLSAAEAGLGDIDEEDEGELDEDDDGDDGAAAARRHAQADLSYTFLQASMHAGARLPPPEPVPGPRVSPMTVEEQPVSARARAAVAPVPSVPAGGAAPVLVRVPSRGAVRVPQPAAPAEPEPPSARVARRDAAPAPAPAPRRTRATDAAAERDAKSVETDPGLAFVEEEEQPPRVAPARLSGGSARERGGRAPAGAGPIRSAGAALMAPPEAVQPQPPAPRSRASGVGVGPAPVDAAEPASGFRRLLRAGLGAAAAAPSDAPAPPAAAQPASAATPAASGPALRSRLREKGRAAPVAAVAAAAPPVRTGAPVRAPAATPVRRPDARSAAAAAVSAPDGGEDSDGTSPLGTLGGEESRTPAAHGIRSFLPLPAPVYAPAPAPHAGRAAPAGGRVKAAGVSSPQRDLEIMHASLRREQLQSRDGHASARGGGGGDSKLAEDAADDDMLTHHVTVGMLVEEEDDLLSAHMAAIQENADLITREGQLLAQVQSRNATDGDYDIDEYAEALHVILSQRLKTTQSMLRQVEIFRQHLAVEEQVASRFLK